MIPPSAVKKFLADSRDDHRWMKKLTHTEVDKLLNDLDPPPKFWHGLLLHQKIGLYLGIVYRRFALWMSMGTGKSLVALELLQYWWDNRMMRRALVFVTSDKAFPTWERQIKQYKITVPFVSLDVSSSDAKWEILKCFGDGIIFLHYPGTVAMVSERVRSKGSKIKLVLSEPKVQELLRSVDALVLDECFPAGTKITTGCGKAFGKTTSIEQIKSGDFVLTWAGLRNVKQVFKKRTTVLVQLLLSDGRKIRCTANHPFFTDLGWVCAGNLVGRHLYGVETVSALWEAVSGFSQQKEILQSRMLVSVQNTSDVGSDLLDLCSDFHDPQIRTEVLQSILLSEFRGKDRTRSAGWQSASREAFVEQGHLDETGIAVEVKPNITQNEAWDFREQSRRKWQAIAKAAADGTECLRPALGTRVCHWIGKEAIWLSNLLQSGCCQSDFEDWNRNRWWNSQQSINAGERSEENSKTGGVRVESVTCEEFVGGIDVFSLEIEDCPHYFAGGVLVHNSTKASSHRSLTYELCLAAAKQCQFRYALSGMPFGRDPALLWPQMNLIDRGASLGPTLGLFREAFFTKKQNYWGGPYSFDYTFKQNMRGRLSEILQHRSITYTADECIDLPDVRHLIEEVRLPAHNLEYYNQVVRELIGSKSNFRAVKNAFLRMRQISSGFLGLKDDETGAKAEMDFDDNPKLERLLELIDELPTDRKALVFYEYTHSGRRIFEEIADAMEIGAVWLWSGTKNPRAALEKFIKDPGCRIAVVNNKVGAYSLDGLQVANYEFHFESALSVMDRSQAEKRIVRQGQKHRCFIYDLVARDTVDSKILSFHREGKNLFEALLVDPESVLPNKIKY